MDETRTKLAFVWVALMLTYLLGDVLRIFSGDFVAGEMDGVAVTQAMYLGVAALMLIPILMVVLSLFLPRRVCRWATIIVSVFFVVFNAVGLPGYAGRYDQFLLVVSFGVNGLLVWLAWTWRPPQEPAESEAQREALT